jgi:NACHT domain
LRVVEDLKDYRTIGLEGKDKELDEYYVHKRDAVLADVDKDWTADDKDLAKKYKPMEIEEIIHRYIEEENEPDEPYLVIGASFGTGKSSLVREMSSRYATDFLDNKQDYIPILVLLGLTNQKGDLITAYQGKNKLNLSLENVLKNIISVDNEISSNRLLLILDGLDEYGDDRALSVGSKLDEILNDSTSNYRYQNTKVLLTSRLENDILTKHHLDKIKKYARLLPFGPTQINYFFEKYGVKIGDRQLTDTYASELKLPVEEMSKPLFAWIFAFLQVDGTGQTALKVESKSHWTSNMLKSWRVC